MGAHYGESNVNAWRSRKNVLYILPSFSEYLKKNNLESAQKERVSEYQYSTGSERSRVVCVGWEGTGTVPGSNDRKSGLTHLAPALTHNCTVYRMEGRKAPPTLSWILKAVLPSTSLLLLLLLSGLLGEEVVVVALGPSADFSVSSVRRKMDQFVWQISLLACFHLPPFYVSLSVRVSWCF